MSWGSACVLKSFKMNFKKWSVLDYTRVQPLQKILSDWNFSFLVCSKNKLQDIKIILTLWRKGKKFYSKIWYLTTAYLQNPAQSESIRTWTSARRQI